MNTKKTYHHGDLRAALIEAARLELEASGLEKFSLRKVAARAGVSHAAPAHHFGDTNGLLTALAAEGFRRFVAAMRAQQLRAGPSAADQLDGAGLGYLDFAMKDKALFRLIFSSERPAHDTDELAQAGAEAYAYLVARVAAVNGLGPEDDQTHQEAAAVWAMAHGIADLVSNGRLKHVSDRPRAEAEVLVRQMLALVRPGAREGLQPGARAASAVS